MSFTILGSETVEGGLAVSLQVPADCPFFRGHFPRFPTLPAVALLDLIARLGAAHTDLGGEPLGLRGLRLRGAIKPDDQLQIVLKPAHSSLGFAVKVNAGAGTQGRFEYTESPAPAVAPLERIRSGDPEPAPALPHEGPARLIKSVLARTIESVLCSAEIPDASPFRSSHHQESEDALIPPLLAIELCAQASAAHGANEPGGSSAAVEAGRGFLVSVRDAWFAPGKLLADQEFFVQARQMSIAAPLRNYAGTVHDAAGRLVAAVQLGTWVP